MPVVLLRVRTATAKRNGTTYLRECKMESEKCRVEEASQLRNFTLSTLHFTLCIHTGLSGSLRLPRKSAATGASVHQKFSFQAMDFVASATRSAGASAAPQNRATTKPTAAAATSPSPRQSWNTPVPRPRIFGGSVSVRYIGMTTAM